MMKQARNRAKPSGARPVAAQRQQVQTAAAITSSASAKPAPAAADGAARPRSRGRLASLTRALVLAIALAGWITDVAAVDRDCRVAFEHLDTNQDQVIDQSEFAMNKVAVIYRAAPRPVSRVGGEVDVIRFERTHISRRAFDELDIDRDGALGPHEIANAPMFQWGWWDRNGDSVLDWTEFHVGCQELER